MVRGAIAIACIWTISWATTSSLTWDYVDSAFVWGAPDQLSYGYLIMALLGGALIGALLACTVENHIGRPWLLAVGFMGPFMLLSLLFDPPAIFLYWQWFALGIVESWTFIAIQAYLVDAVSAELRGRVIAIFVGLYWLTWAICTQVAQLLRQHIEPAWLIAGAGLTAGLLGPLLFARSAVLQVRHSPRWGVADG